MADASKGDINISVPARPEFVHVLRLVACGVAARLELAYDSVNDLALAVDEAFSYLLAAASDPREPTRLILRMSVGSNKINITALADIDAAGLRARGLEESLTWKVLTALAEDAGFIESDEESGIRFSKALPAGSDP
jgi:serine/threonine-protein kinase RsbW